MNAFLILFSILFSGPKESPKYIELADYGAIIRLFNCGDKIIQQGTKNRKLEIKPLKSCSEFFVKCYSLKTNKLIEEGHYKLTGKFKEISVKSSNSEKDTYFKEKHYMVKRIGTWTFYGKTTKKVNY